MSDILEKSLDDIIGEKRRSKTSSNNRHERSNSRRGKGRNSPSFRSRTNNHPYQRLHNAHRSSNSSTRREAYIPKTSNLIPEEILQLAGNRPTLRIKNIHQELNGEDLSKLFNSISSVDFIIFDSKDSTVAYVCYENDCEQSNSEAIAKYNGKKAMGQTLIVENSSSLADRIEVRPKTFHAQSNRQHRSWNDAIRRSDNKIGNKRKNNSKTMEELDQELNEYWKTDEKQAEQSTGNESNKEFTEESSHNRPQDDMNVD